MTKLHIGVVLAITLTAALGACGGKVAIDTSGGIGGPGGGGVGGLGGSGGAGSLCFPDPPDPASLFFCGGGVGAGGSGQQCENDWCDEQGNTWTALCNATTCQCQMNGATMCTCALEGAGNFCVATPTCCPLPGPTK